MNYARLFIISFSIGLIFGLLGAWNNHRNEMTYGSEYSSYRYEGVSNLAIVGMFVDSQIMDVDYRLGEAWQKNRYRIALLNGLVLSIVAGVSDIILKRFLR